MKANIFQLIIGLLVCGFFFFKEIKYIKKKKVFKEGSFLQQSYSFRTLLASTFGIIVCIIALILKLI